MRLVLNENARAIAMGLYFRLPRQEFDGVNQWSVRSDDDFIYILAEPDLHAHRENQSRLQTAEKSRAKAMIDSREAAKAISQILDEAHGTQLAQNSEYLEKLKTLKRESDAINDTLSAEIDELRVKIKGWSEFEFAFPKDLKGL